MKITPIFLIVAQASSPAVLLSLAPIAPAAAQLTPDNTLGTVVNSVNQTTDRIDGGAAQGSNLFHSFQEFNVDAGKSVYFDNPAAIQNILTRVTGSNPSNIFGTLGVLGEANLFLVNPNGIIFGPDASLDIRGSFFATTGDGIKLGPDGIFSATNLEGSQLLNVKPEAIFSNALANHMAELNSQAGLAVGPGSTLALHGGEVNVTGSLGAPGGRVEVLGDNVTVGSSVFIDVSTPTGNGGFVEVSGKNSLQFAGTVDTRGANSTVGTLLLDPKNIEISADGTITGETVSANLSSTDVVLQAENDITVDDDITGTQGNSLSLAAGRSISIEAERTISLEGGNFSARINDENALFSERDEGVAQFVMRPGSQILTNGGDVTIDHGTFGDIAVGEVLLDESIINAGAVSLDDSELSSQERFSFAHRPTRGGNIGITGTGREEDSPFLAGLHVRGDSVLETTAAGNINLTGTGGGGSRGVDIERGPSIKVVDGDIFITGTDGNGTENFNRGVFIRINALIEATGSGNITVTGNARHGRRVNDGVNISNRVEIYSGDGNISVIGTADPIAAVRSNRAIISDTNIIIASRGRGNISFVGTIGTGNREVEQGNFGIRLLNNNIISTNEGDITINIRDNGTRDNSTSVNMTGNSILESKAGNITLTGRGTSRGIDLNDALINPRETGEGTVTLESESINVFSSQLQGEIKFQPPEEELRLNVEKSELISSQEITIGRENSRGEIEIAGELLFNSPVRIAGGEIDTTAANMVGLDEATFTLTASENITTGNIYNPDGTVSINSSNGRVDSSGGTIIDRDRPLEGNIPTTLRPDRTLGSESTVVVPIDAENDRIEGGAIRGSTKLHSFAQFNIESGRGVYFQGEDGIANIISRVTGDDPSNIFGTLGVEGDANLFLLNPHGTLFAPGASLDLNGSFVTTSATAMGLRNGEIFSSNATRALPSQSGNANPSALLFESNNAGKITAQTLLEVPSGESLLLVGGDVEVGGKFLEVFTLGGQLNARGGRIELASVAGAGEAGLEINGNQIELDMSSGISRGDIAVLDGGVVNVAAGGGGDIVVTGNNVQVSGSNIIDNPSLLRGGLEINQGTTDVRAGDITIDATGQVNISTSGRYLGARTLDETPSELTDADLSRNEISGGVVVNSLRRGSAGNAGNINITGAQVNVTGPAGSCCLNRANRAIQSILWPGNAGNAGNITISAENIALDNVTVESSNRSGNLGNAGNIFMEATQEFRANRSGVQAYINGDILFNGEVYGADFNSAGNAGDITIRANNLLTEGGSFFDTSNQGDFGNTGTLSLEAQQQMELIFPFIRSAIAGEGRPGSMNFQGQSVNIGRSNLQPGVAASGGLIEAQTFSSSPGGEINISGESVVIDNRVRLSTETLGSGVGGNINISATSLEIGNGATVGASSQAQGNAGDINVMASEVKISGAFRANPTALLSTADAPGDAGNIRVEADNFQISEGATLNTRTNGEGAGGNITVNANRFAALDGGQLISVTLGEEKAGNIVVNADEVTLDGFDPTFAERTEGIAFDTQTARERIAAANETRNERQGTIVNSQFTIVGPASGLYAGTLADATGDGGEINVTARQLTISDTAAINVDTAGTGRGGDININADDIRMDNGGDINSASLLGVGGGNINIETQDLRLRENSNISTNAGGAGNGGNITINAQTITALDDSFIRANAEEGRGGNIRISSKGVFLDRSSQITATSDRGIDGTVEIQTQVDAARGLVQLDNNPIDAEKILAQNFCVLAKENDSSFIITGRGGIAINPGDYLTGEGIRVGLVDPIAGENSSTSSGSTSLTDRSRSPENTDNNMTDNEIRQAQGWVQLADGTIVLTSYPVISTPHGPLLQHPGCNQSQQRTE